MFNNAAKFKLISINPFLLADGYKMCHADQYPKGIEWYLETWTPRKSRVEKINHVVLFGLQAIIQEVTEIFQSDFFDRPIEELMDEYDWIIQMLFSETNPHFANNYSDQHIRDLHKLGYLPIKIKSLPEGTMTPIKVPMFTIECTVDGYHWLVGYMETLLSSMIWSPMTSATIANLYKRILLKAAEKSSDPAKVIWQAGDFSMRGMNGPEAAIRTSGGHLLNFNMTATVPAVFYLKKYYDIKKDEVGYSPSTEHSVMESYGRDEKKAFLQMLEKVYPSGTFTIVSDTYNFWGVIDNLLPEIKNQIMNRDGRMLIRPDSGDPVKIVCGDPDYDNETIRKGLIERLWEIFGGTINDKGFKELDPHIGAVYGDSITPERAQLIVDGLIAKGFASTNIGLGIGSYTYQYKTRDTFGFALKAIAETQNSQFKKIFKDPKTDTENFKKSQRGLVAVLFEDNDYRLVDDLDPDTYKQYQDKDCLEVIYEDGKWLEDKTLVEVKQRLTEESIRVYGI